MILTVTLNPSIDKRYVIKGGKKGEVNRVKSCAWSAGGKGLNAARAAALLGEPVIAAGILRGHSGQYIAEQLSGHGILNCCIQASGENRSCINIYDESDGSQTEYLEPGEEMTDEEIERFTESYKELVQRCDIVILSGSVPKGNGIFIYKTLIQTAHAAGKKVIADVSGIYLKNALEAGADMVKPNEDEIKAWSEKTLETDMDYIQAGREMQKKSGGIVVISLGKRGSLVVTEEKAYRVYVPEMKSVNTVGCGDCMTAAYAVGFSQGKSLEETMRLAAAASAASAAGEATASFNLEEMKKVGEYISIHDIIFP